MQQRKTVKEMSTTATAQQMMNKSYESDDESYDRPYDYEAYDYYPESELEEPEEDLDFQFVKDLGLLRAKAKQHKLLILEDPQTATIAQIEAEFKTLLAMTRDKEFWKQLNEAERVTLEKYKLALMEATQSFLLKKYKTPILKPLAPPKKPSIFRWVIFGVFIVLELIPMIWGGYLGVTSLFKEVLPWLSETAISVTGFVVCGIEAVLFYAVMGPLLKKGLGISAVEQVKPRLETYEKQLQVLKTIDLIMTGNNQLNSLEYEHCLNLVTLFNEQVQDLKDYAIYVPAKFEDLDLASIEGMAIVVVGKQARIVKDKQYLTNEDGSHSTLDLTPKEVTQVVTQVIEFKLHHGKILRDSENSAFLDQLIKKAKAHFKLETENVSDKLHLPQFKETSGKKVTRWFLGVLNFILNVGGGYFSALSLLAASAATAALVGTPIGWGIITLVILGQLALRLVVRSDAMFNMLNPDAEKHENLREEVNNYTPNTKEYKKILESKKENEKRDRELDELRTGKDSLRTNPHIDSFYSTSISRFHRPAKPKEVESKSEAALMSVCLQQSS